MADFVRDGLPLPAAKVDGGPMYSADVTRVVMPYDYNALKAATESLRMFALGGLDSLGIAVGGPPSDGVTYAQWQATKAGHWAYLDLSALSQSATLQGIGAALQLATGTATLQAATTLQAVAAALQIVTGTASLSVAGSTTLQAIPASVLLTTGTGALAQATGLQAVAAALQAVTGTATLAVTGGGGTVLNFETSDEGMTLSGFARSNTSPIDGSYSLRAAGSLSTATQLGNAQKSVTITNGATVSVKVAANVTDPGGNVAAAYAYFVLKVDGATRATSANILQGDTTAKTLSWASTLATGAHTIELQAWLVPGQDDMGSLNTSGVVQADDITFS